MRETIGINHPDLLLPTKRETLLFDRIGIIELATILQESSAETAANLEWLAEHGVVFDAHLDLESMAPAEIDAVRPAVELFCAVFAYAQILRDLGVAPHAVAIAVGTANVLRRVNEVAVGAPIIDTARVIDQVLAAIHSDKLTDRSFTQDDLAARAADLDIYGIELVTRMTATYYRDKEQLHATPLLKRMSTPAFALPDERVIQIVLPEFPMPSEDTPWDDVLAFRDEAHTAWSLRSLQAWVRKAATSPLSATELQDELQSLIADFTEYMRLRKVAAEHAQISTLVVGTATLLEDLLKLRLSKIVKTLFERRQRAVTLLKEEMSAPGHEVAFIIKAKARFGEPDGA